MVLVSAANTVIVGTLERLRGRAGIVPGSARFNASGGLEFDYDGETTIFWDEQESAIRDEQRIFLDEEGDEWSESELRLVPETELEQEAAGENPAPPP